jgi:hypothetical protein
MVPLRADTEMQARIEELADITLSCWTLSCDVSFMCQRRLAGRAPKILG